MHPSARSAETAADLSEPSKLSEISEINRISQTGQPGLASQPNPTGRRNPAERPADRLPLAGLLALATAAFITILTEALPAGLLPQMSADLGVTEALIGQLVTLYAVGSCSTAIALIAATRGWRRRPLLLLAIGGFAIVNTVTAVSSSYPLILAARFGAGVFAGLLWGLLAGYASRMVAPHLRGKAIAVAMLGTPLALSLGLPAGALLGHLLGWRYAFGIMTAMTVALLAWARTALPDFPGQPPERQLPLARVLAIPGMKPVLFVTLVYVLAHNILYTYIAPFLAPAGLSSQIDSVLLVFGAAAIAGIWLVGLLIARWLRRLTLASIVLFALATLALGLWGRNPVVVYASILAWGVSFGGVATLLQTASANTAGEAADAAQSMIVTVWNLGIAAGSISGGLLLETAGVASFPWVISAALAGTLMVAWRAHQAGFPRRLP